MKLDSVSGEFGNFQCIIEEKCPQIQIWGFVNFRFEEKHSQMSELSIFFYRVAAEVAHSITIMTKVGKNADRITN